MRVADHPFAAATIDPGAVMGTGTIELPRSNESLAVARRAGLCADCRQGRGERNAKEKNAYVHAKIVCRLTAEALLQGNLIVGR